jgi:long-subunit fatty acid transport protein
MSGRAAAAAFAVVAGMASAHANTPEDVLGISARTSALGGAGTALVGDFGAAYYNPAGLAHCRDDMIGIDLRNVRYDLTVKRSATATVTDAEKAPSYTRLSAGLCIQLPSNLAVGTVLGLGANNLMALAQSSADPTPRFPMYGKPLQQLALLLDVAWRPVPELAIGGGISLFIDGALGLSLDVPVAMADPNDPSHLEPLHMDLSLDLGTKVAPYLGAMWTPRDDLRLGATYRGALYTHLQIPATVEAKLVGLDLLIPILVDSIGWYSPHQLAVGASGEPVSSLTLTADLTWYNWGALASSPYPFASVTPGTSDGGGITDQIGFPQVTNPGWHDAWAVRGGAELRLADDHVALRGGYALRTAAIDAPTRSNVNLLDGTVHSLSIGGGAVLGRKPRGFTVPATRGPLTANGTIDLFLRASFMPDRDVPTKGYTYGGTIVDFGVLATMGW